MTRTVRFTKGAIPDVLTFSLYRKKRLTQATRVSGPFEVETTEGTLRCEDGWLALDSKGNPYPISSDEFDAIYEIAP